MSGDVTSGGLGASCHPMPPRKKARQSAEAEEEPALVDSKTASGGTPTGAAPSRRTRRTTKSAALTQTEASTNGTASKEPEQDQDAPHNPSSTAAAGSSRKRKTKAVEADKDGGPSPLTTKEEEKEDPEVRTDTTPEAKPKRARKTKVIEPEEPLRMRTQSMKMLVGAHVSMAKAISNSIVNANHIGANSFALFLKNQRKWSSPDMQKEHIDDFEKRLTEYKYNPKTDILPHGSYLINLAQDDPVKQAQAYECFVDDLKRCEKLGIGRYNFHPGSTASCTREKGIDNVAQCINKAIKETSFVKIVVENMAGHGNIIGGAFEELAAIIHQIKDKSRIGVCLDTCHLFAAGHDLRTQDAYDELMKRFDEVVGLNYLAGMHLNDSKADLGANKDLHQNIGLGYLGLEAFRCVMNDTRLEGLPLILETPSEDENKKEDKQVWAREIELLEWLVGKSADNAEVVAKAAELSAKGEADREKALVAAQKKAVRVAKGRGKKGKAESEEEKEERSGVDSE